MWYFLLMERPSRKGPRRRWCCSLRSLWMILVVILITAVVALNVSYRQRTHRFIKEASTVVPGLSTRPLAHHHINVSMLLGAAPSWWFCMCRSRDPSLPNMLRFHVCSWEEVVEHNRHKRTSLPSSSNATNKPHHNASTIRPLTCIFHNVVIERFPHETPYVWRGAWRPTKQHRRGRSIGGDFGNGRNFVTLHVATGARSAAVNVPWFLAAAALHEAVEAASDSLQTVVAAAHANQEDLLDALTLSSSEHLALGDAPLDRRTHAPLLEQVFKSLMRNDTDGVLHWWNAFQGKCVEDGRAGGGAQGDVCDHYGTQFPLQGQPYRRHISVLALIPYHDYAYFSITGILRRVLPPLLAGLSYTIGTPMFSALLQEHVSIVDWFDHEREGRTSHPLYLQGPLTMSRWPSGSGAVSFHGPILIGGAQGLVSGGASVTVDDQAVIDQSREYVLRAVRNAPSPQPSPRPIDVCSNSSQQKRVIVYVKRPCSSSKRNTSDVTTINGTAVSRGRGDRCILNEGEFESYLIGVLGQTYGLQVSIEDYTKDKPNVCAQVRAASEADVMIGVHGSGLVHALWMPATCAHLVELFADRDRYERDGFWYRDLLREYHNGVSSTERHLVWYGQASGTTRGASQDRKNDDFVVDIPSFHEALMAHLRRDARWTNVLSLLQKEDAARTVAQVPRG